MRRASSHYRLAYWDSVAEDDQPVPAVMAASWLRSWVSDPANRHEVVEVCDLIGLVSRRAPGWLDEGELHRFVRPAIERALTTGELVLLERFRPAPLPEMAQPRGEVAPPVLSDTAMPALTWIEFQVQDTSGSPMAGVRYEARLTDDSKRTGTTDSGGMVRFDSIQPGLVEFRLLDFGAGDIEKLGDAAAAGAGKGAATDQTVEIELVDSGGQPLGGQRFVVESAGGAKQEGSTADNGKGKVAGLAAGEYTVSFPDLAKSA